VAVFSKIELIIKGVSGELLTFGPV